MIVQYISHYSRHFSLELLQLYIPCAFNHISGFTYTFLQNFGSLHANHLLLSCIFLGDSVWWPDREIVTHIAYQISCNNTWIINHLSWSFPLLFSWNNIITWKEIKKKQLPSSLNSFFSEYYRIFSVKLPWVASILFELFLFYSFSIFKFLLWFFLDLACSDDLVSN